MGSDSKDEGHEMVYDHEYTEAGNDDLKPRSNKMKEVVSRMNKGIKVTKGKPNQNNPKITKKNTPNKIKSEIPDEPKTKPKPKLKPKDVTKYQPNMEVHNMSSSPDTMRDVDEDDDHDGTVKTNRLGLKMVDVQVRKIKDKDKLVTTPSGELIRRESYTIPRILR